MAMSKEEKKNVLIAIVLSVAAVIVVWLLSGTASLTYSPANVSELPTPGPSGDTINPVDAYNAYNIPPFVPPSLSGVQPAAISTNTNNNSGNGCGCDVCGPPGSGQQQVLIPFYNQFLG